MCILQTRAFVLTHMHTLTSTLNRMILAVDCTYYQPTHETKLNNQCLVSINMYTEHEMIPEIFKYITN